MGECFHCRRCGNCCRKLTERNWSGLSLFPWEKHLFPENDVYPHLGLGENPEHPNFRIILYLYIAQRCVYLEENTCTNHDERPIVCRSYPFRTTVSGENTLIYEAAPECTAIKDRSIQFTFNSKTEELYAAEEIGSHLTRFYTSLLKRWKYDLDSGWFKI